MCDGEVFQLRIHYEVGAVARVNNQIIGLYTWPQPQRRRKPQTLLKTPQQLQSYLHYVCTVCVGLTNDCCLLLVVASDGLTAVATLVCSVSAVERLDAISIKLNHVSLEHLMLFTVKLAA